MLYLPGRIKTVAMPTDTKKKISVKIPKELHGELKKKAEKEGRILERVVADVLEKGLKAEKQQ